MSVPIASTSTSSAAIESASTSVAIASTSTSSSASITVPNSPVHLTRFKRFREDTYFVSDYLGKVILRCTVYCGQYGKEVILIVGGSIV